MFVTDDFKQGFFISRSKRVQWKNKQNDEQEMTGIFYQYDIIKCVNVKPSYTENSVR